MSDNTVIHLSNSTLNQLPPDIETPSYDRSQVKTGVVHIGPGAFFRGHQAVYLDDLLNEGEMDWGVCAVSLKSTSMRDTLSGQDYLYTVVRQTGHGDSARVIGSITDGMVAYENPQAVIDKMADPEVKLVTLTVTQKGYYYDSANGQIDFSHPDIQQCLDDTSDPVSTVGYIVAALEKRMKNGDKPFTVMSCDNLPGNGNILRNVVLAYAGQKSKDLREWIAKEVTFPNTMVDRIVPRTTEAEVSKIRSYFKLKDEWPIYTEPFRQFVIEDKFCNDRPDLEKVGVLVIDDVVPYELMKIRILNGSHMALGVTGFLSGYQLGNKALENADIKKFIEGFMDEVIETLPPVEGIDIQEYKQDIMDRISNLPDDLTRLARNGSQKVSSRFLEPLRDAMPKGTPYDHIAFAIASWMSYLKGEDAAGRAFDINDEEGIRLGLQTHAKDCGNDASTLLATREIFGADLSSNANFTSKVEMYFKDIQDKGMLKALQDFAQGGSNLTADPAAPSTQPDLKI